MANSSVSSGASLFQRLLDFFRGFYARDRLAFALSAAVCCCLLLNIALVLSRLPAPAVRTALPVEFSEPEPAAAAFSGADGAEVFREPVVKPMRYLKNKPEPFIWPEETEEEVPAFVPVSGSGVWLQIPNSYINAPVAQGSDNSFYLTHNVYGGYDWRGCIFAHYRCSLSSIGSLSQNTVLFGHNKSTNRYGGEVSNFTTLPRFQDFAFADSHRIIYLSINGETAAFVVFAALDCEVWNDAAFPYWYPSVSDSIIREARQRSYWDYDVDVSSGDRLLTLSTCSYDWGYDANYNTYAKFVVMARMLRPGETVNSFGSISANTDRQTPSRLSRVQG